MSIGEPALAAYCEFCQKSLREREKRHWKAKVLAKIEIISDNLGIEYDTEQIEEEIYEAHMAFLEEMEVACVVCDFNTGIVQEMVQRDVINPFLQQLSRIKGKGPYPSSCKPIEGCERDGNLVVVGKWRKISDDE